MDIPSLSAAVLVQRLSSGELLSEQIVDALFARTEAVDGEIHGYALPLREQALREAVAADDARRRGESLGPLHGVPITIKENIATEGHDVTMGVRARRDAPAPRDAIVVRALRNAGAIVLGKSNVPQTLLALETTNALFGTTCNPWNLERGPGGSTGGEAALIASGQSPWGVGSDIGGSIRIPAAFCGVCGFKPSGQRWSNVGSSTIMPGQEWVKAQVGVLAREMADVTLLCRVLDEAPEQRLDPAVAPCIHRDPTGVDVTKLTIGYYIDDGLFTPAKSVQRAVEEAAKTLESRGARVVPMAPDNAREMLAAYFRR